MAQMSFGLPETIKLILDRNSGDIQKKFHETFRSKPSDTDGPGYVYGFIDLQDYKSPTNLMIKLGRTSRDNPYERVKEWGGKMQFCVQTIYNKKLERLVHLLFNFAHTHRSEMDRQSEREWFHFRERINVNFYVAELNLCLDEYFSSSQINRKEERFVSIGKTEKSKIRNKVNINTASLHEILTDLAHCQTKSGRALGDVLARRVIEHRPFRNIKELESVPGIGPKKILALQDHICF